MTVVDTLILPKDHAHIFVRADRGVADHLGCLDEVSEYTIPFGGQPHIAMEVLDPWVFWQMVTGLNNHYTVNGTPTASNWRLLPAAGRMAVRLGLDELADEIAKAVADCAAVDPARLDIFDQHSAPGAPLTEIEAEQFFQMLDRRFRPFAHEDTCLPRLSKWVEAELPRKFVADKTQWKIEIDAIWAKVHEIFPDVRRTRLTKRLGSRGCALVEAVGIFDAYQVDRPVKLEPPAYFERWMTQDGRMLARIDFADGSLVVDLETMSEMVRIPGAAMDRGEATGALANLADHPRLGLSPDGTRLVKLGMFSSRKHALKYRN